MSGHNSWPALAIAVCRMSCFIWYSVPAVPVWLLQLLSLGLLGVGLVLLSLAVWLLARPRSSLPLLLLSPLPLPLLLLASLAGLVLLAAAILGLCAAARQARLLTATWQLLLLVLLLAESGRLPLVSLTECPDAAVTVLCLLHQRSTLAAIQGNLASRLRSQFGADKEFSRAVNYVQSKVTYIRNVT